MLDDLKKPFPTQAVKSRKGGGGTVFYYVDGTTVMDRLNAAVGEWNFEIVREWTEGNAFKAHGRLTIPLLGSREHVGVSIPRNKPGTEDADAKGHITDALKKCATMFGVAREFYGPDFEDHPVAPVPTMPVESDWVTNDAPNPQATIASLNQTLAPRAPMTTAEDHRALNQPDPVEVAEKDPRLGDPRFVPEGQSWSSAVREAERELATAPPPIPADRPGPVYVTASQRDTGEIVDPEIEDAVRTEVLARWRPGIAKMREDPAEGRRMLAALFDEIATDQWAWTYLMADAHNAIDLGMLWQAAVKRAIDTPVVMKAHNDRAEWLHKNGDVPF